MQIRRGRIAGKIWLSQAKYIQNILERFNMNEAKPVTTPLAAHYRLNALQCLTIEKKVGRDEQSALCKHSRMSNVRDGLHKTWPSTSIKCCFEVRAFSTWGKMFVVSLTLLDIEPDMSIIWSNCWGMILEMSSLFSKGWMYSWGRVLRHISERDFTPWVHDLLVHHKISEI